MTTADIQPLSGIAIVGMAGRFPGARSIEEFWRNLCGAVDSISFFSPEELIAAGADPELVRQPNYVPARGALGDAEFFDAAFFGHSPTVAALMDPQHRLFLECAWTALEHAGCDAEQYQGRIGVFAGESMNTYLLNNVISHMRMVASVDSLQASIGNDKDSLTTEVAYKLNLTGPSVTIQTSSSTSLVAVHMACQSLLSYECDAALAGGVSIHFPETAGYLYQEGGATSPDGRCRTFDAKSKGFVNGHGAGVVVLKRLENALEDGDTVYAVIRGSAVNNDGAVKVSYMAPSVDGQAAVIEMAQAMAGVEPESISYVEAHGTATSMGDPIEVAALTQAFRAGTDKKQFCALGSLKTNIGHLDAAAGVAGLIKTALALHHRQIPASLHYTAPNPQIDFANSPFFVNTALAEWRTENHPRRAGVSSFGMGGTNAHAVLEEAPELPPSGPAQPWQLLTLSAKTATALETMTANLGAYLRQHPDLNLADVAYTLQAGRRSFGHRRTLVAHDLADAAAALENNDPERLFSTYQESSTRPVMFMFSGQGAQYVGMAAGLYRDEPVFRDAIDRCAALLNPHLGTDIRTIIFEQPETESTKDTKDTNGSGHDNSKLNTQNSKLRETRFAQPALFAVEYALAQLWLDLGLKPQAMIGHSIGEYVAATLAGVFTLEDALALVAARGRLMQEMEPGAMLAVPLPEGELLPLLGDRLSLAAVNGPRLCVVAGPHAAVEQLEQELGAQGLTCRRLHTSHAFHSAMMEPVVAPFVELVRRVRLSPPQIAYVSNVTGDWISAEQATDPAYWGRHLRQAVRFADGLAALLAEQDAILLEVGPGQNLATLARQHPARAAGQVVLNTLRHPNERLPDRAFLLTTLGRLWLAGLPLDAARLYGTARRRVPLPTYPFERQRHWLEPIKQAQAPLPEPGKRAGIADWFYLPSWRMSLPQPAATGAPQRWLVFADACGMAEQVAGRLEQAGRQVVLVRAGQGFEYASANTYRIDPASRLDYELLLADLGARDALPDAVLHAWSVTPPSEHADFAAAQRHGLYSLLALAQTLGAQSRPAHLVVVSSQMQSVAGEAALHPEKATLLGPCRVIPQEYPHLSCQSIDVLTPTGGRQAAQLAERLAAECLAPTPGGVLAYRGAQRWERAFEPVRLEATGAALRQGGVYLITGGFGGVGLALAGQLARNAGARLALVSRTALPPRAEWPALLAAGSSEIARRIQAVQALEATGAEVLALAADVAQPEQLRAAIDQTRTHYGALHGVIHGAGLVGRAFFRPIQELDADACEQHFLAKVHGTAALEAALEGQELDFCMLHSSLSTALGGLGLCAYAAANSFMDAFAQRHNRNAQTPWISVGWDGWELSEQQRRDAASAEPSGEFLLSASEGGQVFERILAAAPAGQVLVSTGDLAARLDRWTGKGLRAEPTAAVTSGAAISRAARPSLPNPYVAPRSETERTIAAIWQETLGVEQVGLHDNFFDLGGNSLTGIKVIGRVKERFNVQIPTVTLYEGPTVGALARLIEQDEPDQAGYEQGRNRGAARRERRRERQGTKEIA